MKINATIYFSIDADQERKMVGSYRTLDDLLAQVEDLARQAFESDQAGDFSIAIEGRGKLPREKSAGGRKRS